ncbi:hypothetical protein [Haliangium sp.]|uniref:hypothetical protein n=1 Tax=Haliangium sp. TaxID=2663208 RepID=UPI003D139533
MKTRPHLILALLLIAATGCDPNAKAQNNDRVLNLSKEHESCASSPDCSAGLRCFDAVCRSTESSLIGDYYAAAGARALAAGEVDKAVAAYTAAVNRYQSDKKAIPATLHCGYGRALLGARDDRDQAEESARALHRCLREAPVGSSVRARALADLAVLGDSGLDPELLAGEGDMAAYLTKQPAAPSTDDLRVTASGDVKTRSRTYTGFLEQIQAASARGPLLACWEANWKATREEELSVTLPFRQRFVEGAYEEDDRDQISIDGDEPAPGTPERCVYDALGALADEFTKGKRTGNRWDGNITVRISE